MKKKFLLLGLQYVDVVTDVETITNRNDTITEVNTTSDNYILGMFQGEYHTRELAEAAIMDILIKNGEFNFDKKGNEHWPRTANKYPAGFEIREIYVKPEEQS